VKFKPTTPAYYHLWAVDPQVKRYRSIDGLFLMVILSRVRYKTLISELPSVAQAGVVSMNFHVSTRRGRGGWPLLQAGWQCGIARLWFWSHPDI